jgi:hypothetical protein
MEYCGVKFLAVKAELGPLWKWRVLHTHCCTDVISGEAEDRTGAIADAHNAIGKSLRATSESEQSVRLPHLADQALHILHGARELPTTQAVDALQPFVKAMRHQTPNDTRLGDVSAAAVNRLIHSLTTQGTACDDVWQSAIDTTLSFANEMSDSFEQAS